MFLPPAADSLPASHLATPLHLQALITCIQASTLPPSSLLSQPPSPLLTYLPMYVPPYPTPLTTLQHITRTTTQFQFPPPSATPYQYTTLPSATYQYPTPPSTPHQFPTPPPTPCSAPSTPIPSLHQDSSPSLDPGDWRHPNLVSSHLPTAPPGVTILLIKGNPVKLPLFTNSSCSYL